MTSHLQTWPLYDAKARFSELVDRCLANGPQIVSRHGKDTVVMITMEDWQRFQASSRQSLKDILLDEKWWTDDDDLNIPDRHSYKWNHRPIPDFSE